MFMINTYEFDLKETGMLPFGCESACPPFRRKPILMALFLRETHATSHYTYQQYMPPTAECQVEQIPVRVLLHDNRLVIPNGVRNLIFPYFRIPRQSQIPHSVRNDSLGAIHRSFSRSLNSYPGRPFLTPGAVHGYNL